MNILQLTGISNDHTVKFYSEFAWCDTNLRVHKDIVTPLETLCVKAYRDGEKLALLSGYRSYQRQVDIWEMKNSGERAILDDNNIALQNFISDEDKFNKIARWSALPGLSRHHWGTDLDIFSAAAIQSGCEVQLIGEEFDQNGPCENLNRWMQQNLEKFAFYLPYQKDMGGVAPEPWHISYQPQSSTFKTQLSSHNLSKVWAEHPWCGSAWACKHSQLLFDKYSE